MTSSNVIDLRQDRIKFNLDLIEKYRLLLGDAVPLPDYETCKLAIDQILTKRGTLYKSAPSIDSSPFGHILWYALDYHDGNGYVGTMMNLSTFKCPMVAKRHGMDASSLFNTFDTLARVLASKDDSLNTNASKAWDKAIKN
jgi:hypothetical protein